VLTYVADTCVINKPAEKTLMTFEGNILRKIFGALIDVPWRIRTNVELEKLLDVNIGSSIKRQRLIYSGWMMQGTPRKYTEPTYTKNDLRGDPRLDGKMM